jgi:hypothetical protein
VVPRELEVATRQVKGSSALLAHAPHQLGEPFLMDSSLMGKPSASRATTKSSIVMAFSTTRRLPLGVVLPVVPSSVHDVSGEWFWWMYVSSVSTMM